MYGGGALLIREIARATGRGWPSILLLGGAYAMLEEAFTTQSLFNPDYLHLHMGLLNAGYVPALGMGAWWTLWMLNVHPIWSIATPILLAEGLFPDRAQRPWLGPVGHIVVCVVFAFGLVASTAIGWRQDHFLARPFQFAIGGALLATFACAAFAVPMRRVRAGANSAPGPWIAGICAFIPASATLLINNRWGWWAFALLLALDLTFLILALRWSSRPNWRPHHVLALGSAAALAYAWHSFIQPQVVGKPGPATLIGKVILAAGTVAHHLDRTGVRVTWPSALGQVISRAPYSDQDDRHSPHRENHLANERCRPGLAHDLRRNKAVPGIRQCRGRAERENLVRSPVRRETSAAPGSETSVKASSSANAHHPQRLLMSSVAEAGMNAQMPAIHGPGAEFAPARTRRIGTAKAAQANVASKAPPIANWNGLARK